MTRRLELAVRYQKIYKLDGYAPISANLSMRFWVKNYDSKYCHASTIWDLCPFTYTTLLVAHVAYFASCGICGM